MKILKERKILQVIGFLLIMFILLPGFSISKSQEVPKDRLSLWAEEGKRIKKSRIVSILKKFRTGLSIKTHTRLAELIYTESYQNGFDPELILALVVRESSIYNWSQSRVGAMGLMQIRPTTGRAMAKAINIPWKGKKTLFNPHLNIKLGIHYLNKLVDRFEDIEIALTAYNYGPTRIAQRLKNKESLPKAYAHRILATYQRFRELNQTQLVESWDPNEPVQTLGENSFEYMKI